MLRYVPIRTDAGKLSQKEIEMLENELTHMRQRGAVLIQNPFYLPLLIGLVERLLNELLQEAARTKR